jgi:hypothetical protein
MLAAVVALLLQQAAPAAPPASVVWQSPPPPAAPSIVAVQPPAAAVIPDWARADPYGYERSECSPLMRSEGESLEACQARVRADLASSLGAALPPGLAAAGTSEECRQAATGDRYALQCGAPPRSGAPAAAMVERTCETRPVARPEGGVVWSEQCRPADGVAPAEDGLRLRLGDGD